MIPAQAAIEGRIEQVALGLLGKQLAHDLLRQVSLELHRQQLAEHAAWTVAAYTRLGACDGGRGAAIVERAIAQQAPD